MDNWREYLLPPTATLEDAIVVLQQNQCVVIVDNNERLVGTLTDRDVRRALLKHHSMDSKVVEIMNSSPTSLSHPYEIQKALSVHQKSGFEQYPIVDEQQVVIGLYTDKELIKVKLSNPVVLMAGGVGSRLAPLTNDFPKPLLSVGKYPVLETTLRELVQAGFENFWISVNYHAEMIEEHFGNGENWSVSIQYLREEEPLGTAGSLRLLPEMSNESVLVLNGDLLTKLNYHMLLEFHKHNQAKMTVGVREYDHQVPYGVLELEDVHVVRLEEKPIKKYFINAGIYVLESEMIQRIPNCFFNMTDLLTQVMQERKVAAFPVHEYWADIGQLEDLHRAKLEYDKVFLSKE